MPSMFGISHSLGNRYATCKAAKHLFLKLWKPILKEHPRVILEGAFLYSEGGRAR